MMFEHVLFFSVYLFSIGIYGLITSRNMVRALICLELILNSINLNLVTFSDLFDSRQLKGDIFAIFVIADFRLPPDVRPPSEIRNLAPEEVESNNSDFRPSPDVRSLFNSQCFQTYLQLSDDRPLSDVRPPWMPDLNRGRPNPCDLKCPERLFYTPHYIYPLPLRERVSNTARIHPRTPFFSLTLVYTKS
ncbi:hypothetical protein ZWY2020_021319 [Hordeum vulgare]|nr:hypothetical protein ZWY2020_021319 [Hordeum vulgare]